VLATLITISSKAVDHDDLIEFIVDLCCCLQMEWKGKTYNRHHRSFPNIDGCQREILDVIVKMLYVGMNFGHEFRKILPLL